MVAANLNLKGSTFLCILYNTYTDPSSMSDFVSVNGTGISGHACVKKQHIIY